MTVNGKFPGPAIIAREGDRVVVEVVNHVKNNVSIHWYVKISFHNIIFCHTIKKISTTVKNQFYWLIGIAT